MRFAWRECPARAVPGLAAGQRGSPVEPLRVIHDAYQRLLPGDLGQQAQHRKAGQEPIRRRSRGGGQGNSQGANRRDAPAECAIVTPYMAMSAKPEKRTDPMSSGFQQTRTGMV
jgi:hypothetical protein